MKKKTEKKSSFDEDVEHVMKIFKNINSTVEEIKAFAYPTLNRAKICNKIANNTVNQVKKLQDLTKILFFDNSIGAKDLELV